ncbi:nucleoside diphosphate kinase regulator [Kaistia sp. 32K]|uniref:nucleoside diphosphate kinase regulator n=1 Tax=Kaistia sp. 32K TaxID=2795690 RepID=UPI0019160BBE|nr:nucleoside diphosphate kinase regulator [Kaistia sp. 32K]BCP55744.1 nucleoside diphosphate kinase regulator [Kaistia sp. 32K]
MTTRSPGRLRPRITILAADHERLSTLARAATHSHPDVAEVLNEELDRARVVADAKRSHPFVRMGHEVEYRDDTAGMVRKVTLVYPEQADIGQGRISVLTPIGAALIGVGVGESISWETRNGELKRLTVLQVGEAEAV